ncbi:MAG: hypothetical protein A3H98_02150 [Bacteroidetes bacterium RIFCSPLOWO2_02_FULL_36_8]|nr:MAG: hypothetical protein A3H98_02150 [Bacteroidetes bacterium RIFCSPLOWO2_02_FULL_36_8]OFY69206.1 MAG: hypothetical protein A3G23_06565 [Bacteroidetes bacterium RIFCSPLOWO2_12_FULL_37_12]
MRFYLIDKVLEINIGKSIKGIKCWSLSDEIFNDHFPGFPVVPGVLLVESAAQLLGILIAKSFQNEYPDKEEIYPILSMIHKAKFRDIVVPGDCCEITGTLKTIDYTRASGSAEVFVEKKLMAQIELSFGLVSKKINLEGKYGERRHNEFLGVVTRNMSILKK